MAVRTTYPEGWCGKICQKTAAKVMDVSTGVSGLCLCGAVSDSLPRGSCVVDRNWLAPAGIT